MRYTCTAIKTKSYVSITTLLMTFLSMGSLYAETPNILIFFADDMGQGDSRTYADYYGVEDLGGTTGRPPAMPALETLAEEGMMFTDAHTQDALCAPSRYTILSGNHVWRGVSAGGKWGFAEGTQFRSGQKSIANVLREQANYNTAMFGKSHLGGRPTRPDGSPSPLLSMSSYTLGREWENDDWTKEMTETPHNFGFNYSYLLHEGIQHDPWAYFQNNKMVMDPSQLHDENGNGIIEYGEYDLHIWANGQYGEDGQPYNSNTHQERSQLYGQNAGPNGTNEGFGVPSFRTYEVGPTLAQEAIDFIDRHYQTNSVNGTSHPFFIHYCSQAVHVQHTPPTRFTAGDIDEPVKGVTGGTAHMDMLYELDLQLKAIMNAIEKHGQLDNTIIIFTSDNGGLRNGRETHVNGGDVTKNEYFSNIGSGHKATIFEGGHRVPLIFRWPNHISAGTVSHQLSGVLDIFATLIDITNVEHEPDQGLDSKSLWPILNGSATTNGRTVLYQQGGGDRAIRVGDMKLIFERDNAFAPIALYDLSGGADGLFEDELNSTDNLINNPAYSDLIDEMTAEYNNHISVFQNRTENVRTTQIVDNSDTPIVLPSLKSSPSKNIKYFNLLGEKIQNPKNLRGIYIKKTQSLSGTTNQILIDRL